MLSLYAVGYMVNIRLTIYSTLNKAQESVWVKMLLGWHIYNMLTKMSKISYLFCVSPICGFTEWRTLLIIMMLMTNNFVYEKIKHATPIHLDPFSIYLLREMDHHEFKLVYKKIKHTAAINLALLMCFSGRF